LLVGIGVIVVADGELHRRQLARARSERLAENAAN
jgi:hypothetical protein